MTSSERLVRAHVIQTLSRTGAAPSIAETAASTGGSEAAVRTALHALADAHRLVLVPGTDTVRMAHPFSAVPTDFVVTIGGRRWFANCVWDGLSILGLLGDGTLTTHSPATRKPIELTVTNGTVSGEALVH
ncbi:MAG: alkylmercury lyase, partial [Acidobacteriota bacterium]|nr:alkylmercury lyase [Acidobacteriota bacterium]